MRACFFWLLTSILISINLGCASLFNRYQSVKIVTSPANAQVYHDGQYVGESPTYAKLKRHYSSELEIQFSDNQKKTFPLQTKYDWSNSFGPNAMMIYPPLAGIGLGVDFATGAAWKYRDLPVLKINSHDTPASDTPIKKIAVATPFSGSHTISKQIALLLQEKFLKLYPKAQIIPYKNSQPTFEKFSWNHERPTEKEGMEDLYASLGVSHILVSRVLESDATEDIVVNVELLDVFTGKNLISPDIRLSKNDIPYYKASFLKKSWDWLVARTPNNFGLSSSTQSTYISGGDASGYTSEEVRSDSPLSYLSGISIRRVQGSEGFKHWKFKFEWVPSATILERQLQFHRQYANALAGVDYHWLSGYWGIGPQLTLHMPVGRLYLEVIPSIGLSHISWKQGSYHNDFRGVFAMQLEFGYLLFISDRFNFRVFASSTSADREQWESVLAKSTGEYIKLKDSSYTSAGISLSYYWPELSSTMENLND